MKKILTSIQIQAPKEKVWDTMLGKETYEEWTKVFDPNSTYEGDWSEGSKIYFLSKDKETEGTSGMVSRIAKNTPYEFISIEHLGIVKDGVEDTQSDEAKSWAPSFENYRFVEKDGGTLVEINQDIEDQYHDDFEKMWHQALITLKQLAEK